MFTSTMLFDYVQYSCTIDAASICWIIVASPILMADKYQTSYDMHMSIVSGWLFCHMSVNF